MSLIDVQWGWSRSADPFATCGFRLTIRAGSVSPPRALPEYSALFVNHRPVAKRIRPRDTMNLFFERCYFVSIAKTDGAGLLL